MRHTNQTCICGADDCPRCHPEGEPMTDEEREQAEDDAEDAAVSRYESQQDMAEWRAFQ